MEIDITGFVNDADPFEFSASRAERGQNAGAETWQNAMDAAGSSPLLRTEDQLEALRAHVRGFGAWSDEEIAEWSDAKCNALFIQLVSGDMREAGMDECDPEEFDWEEYEERAREGQVKGCLYRGDDGRIYYYLGM